MATHPSHRALPIPAPAETADVPTRPVAPLEDAHPHVAALARGEHRHVFLVAENGRAAALAYVETAFGIATREGIPYLEVRLSGHEADEQDAD